jgi:hypothetical protein
VVINFYSFNDQCQGVQGWSSFINAVWNHEQQHFNQAQTELLLIGNNIYLELETMVDASALAAHNRVTAAYNRIQTAMTGAGGVEPTGNWTTTFWIWASASNNEFFIVLNPNF